MEALAEVALRDDHCDRLFWFAEKDMPERGIKKGETYCYRCPGISFIGTHCCLANKCEERIKEGKKKFWLNWKKLYPEWQPTNPEAIKVLQ